MLISDLGVPAAARRRAGRGVSMSPLSAAPLAAGGACVPGTGRTGPGHAHGAAGARDLGWQIAGFAQLQALSVPAVVTKPGTTNIRKQYMPMTRVNAADGDGAPGAHPARETA